MVTVCPLVVKHQVPILGQTLVSEPSGVPEHEPLESAVAGIMILSLGQHELRANGTWAMGHPIGPRTVSKPIQSRQACRATN